MRIVLASDFYHPFIGGTERQVQLLGRQLRARGHELWVATVQHEGQPAAEQLDGLEVRRLGGLTTSVPWFSSNERRRYHPPFPDPGIVLGLRRLVREVRPDVVNANGWIAYSCAVALAGTGVRLVVSVRDHGHSCAIRTLLRDGAICDGPALGKCLACAGKRYGPAKGAVSTLSVFAGRELLRRTTDVAHCNSGYVREVVRGQLFADGGRAEVVQVPDLYDPASLRPDEEREEVRAVLARLPAEPFILFVGSLQAHKGVHVLLDAYARLETEVPLVLIGTAWSDSPTRFPPGVTVLHDVPHLGVMAAWRRSLYGVAPSIWPETFGGVLVEAMLTGRAVITTDLGGQAEVVQHQDTGLLVPPGDPAALALAMRWLLEDGALRERLGRNGSVRVRRLAAPEVVQEFERIYGGAVAEVAA